MSNFGSYGRYYDLLYKDKKYSDEADYIHNLLSTYSPHQVNTLLELGCGSGNHAQYLSNKEIHITGIERSEEMVNLAKTKGIFGFKPVLGDIVDFHLNAEFDAAIGLFHVISYLTDNEAVLSCFKSTNEHLKRGGLFIFDVWYTPAVLDQKPETRVKKLSNDSIEVTRIAMPTLNHFRDVVDVFYEVWVKDKSTGSTEVFTENHPMRHFSVPEMALIAQITGFRLIHAEAYLSGNKPDTNSWGVCFILSKCHDH